MSNFGIKYFLALAGVIAFFLNAIACGTQMYQVSVKEDFDDRSAEKANPEMKNPASPMYGVHAANGWVTLPIKFRFGEHLTKDQQTELLSAMKQWEWAVGRQLFDPQGIHTGVDGDSFKDLYSSLKDDVNGDYMDNNWAKTSKPDHVLATTIWDNGTDPSSILKADIRFNAQHYVIGDSLALAAVENKEVVDMQSLALHEVGHLLGLAHCEPEVDKYSIMNPSLFIGEGLTSREMSEGDIKRIQSIYGCEGISCDIPGLLAQRKQALAAQKTAVAPKASSTPSPTAH